MKNMKKQFLATCCALIVSCSVATAEPVKWDFSDEYGSKLTDLTYLAAKNCIAEVEKIAGNDIKFSYQGGGVLGLKSADHFEAVSTGIVQSAITLLTQLSGVDPLFNLSSIPFVASSPDEAYLLWQAAKPEYEKVFNDNNMILLWALPNAPSGIHAREPITSTDVIDGLRIRTYDKNGTDTLKAAGAAPLQVAWSDLVPQLSTGGIDAVLTSAEGGKSLSVWDYGVNNFTEINYAMALFVAHVNKDAFNSLSENAQSAILDTVDTCEKYNWNLMEEARIEHYPSMIKSGMTITLDDDVPQEVFDRLQTAAETVKQSWLEQVGVRGESVLKAFEASKSK